MKILRIKENQKEMGIKSGINKFLQSVDSDIFEEVHMSNYAFKKIAVDFTLYLNKFKAIAGEKWMKLFIRMVAGLRRNHVHCVFIYDGVSPPEKKAEQEERRANKEKNERRVYEIEMALEHYHDTGEVKKILKDLYGRRRSPTRLLHKKKGEEDVIDIKWVENKLEQLQNQIYEITKEDFAATKELFDILKVPYYTAPTEAETMCADLCKRGFVDAVLSEDTDVMAYGTPIFLSKLDNITFETCRQIRYTAILEALELKDDQFLDLCIMCGTDYNPNIVGIGSKTAYKHILDHGSIEEFVKNVKPRQNKDPKKCQDFSVLNYVRSRQLFREYPKHKMDYVPFCGIPDFKKLGEFMEKHDVSVRMDTLQRDFAPPNIIIEDEEDEFVIESDDEENININITKV